MLNTANKTCLVTEQLGLKTGSQWRLQPLNLTLHTGEILAVCGPNGAGKSTLLGLLSGEITPTTGQVRLLGKALAQWHPATLARHRARLEQENPISFDFTVEEVIALGRYAWGDDQPDSPIVQQAMQAAGAWSLKGRKITRLSGGERQRVQLARVLAQVWGVEGAVLLLDEPMSAQDLGQQQLLLRNLRQLAKAHAWSLVCVLHDLNLAAIFADRLLLLDQGQLEALGEPSGVLDIARLSDVYCAELTAWHHPSHQHQLIMLDD